MGGGTGLIMREQTPPGWKLGFNTKQVEWARTIRRIHSDTAKYEWNAGAIV